MTVEAFFPLVFLFRLRCDAGVIDEKLFEGNTVTHEMFMKALGMNSRDSAESYTPHVYCEGNEALTGLPPDISPKDRAMLCAYHIRSLQYVCFLSL